MFGSYPPACRSASWPFRSRRADTFPIEVDAMQTVSRRRFGQFILAGLMLLNVAGPARSDTTLRWKFTPGQKRTYVLTKKTTMKMEVMGRPTETITTQTVDFT
jgi:hypothetical protein